jgi:lipopolysaccharide transport system permease protein
MKINLPFSVLHKSKDLIIQLSLREIRMRYRGSKLGQLWVLINPALMLSLYLFIFGLVFQGRFGVIEKENYFDFALELFVSLTMFNIISETINTSPTLILAQPNFVKKIVFPLDILSILKLISCLYFSLYNIILILILIPFSHCHLSYYSLELPLLIIPIIFISLGISWGLSALGVFFRDLNHITSFISTALMYGSAIVYSPLKLPVAMYNILKYNPILLIIDQIRCILLWGKGVSILSILEDYAYSILILLIGRLIFQRLRHHFADII